MSKYSTRLLKAIIPILLGLIIALIPPPAGLGLNAWRYFALFVAVIAGIVLEPIPGPAIGLIGVTLAAISLLVYSNPTDSIKWALSGFSDVTVWLIFSAFMFALGFSKSGLGRRIALLFVKYLGKNSLLLGYSIALIDLVLAPFTPSNTARSGGTVYPIIRNIPEIYGSQPGPTARKIGSYIMWVAFASTCVTSTMFLTALSPNVLALSLISKNLNVTISWTEWVIAFAPATVILFIIIPVLTYILYPPEIKKSPEASKWASIELEKMGRVKFSEIGMLVILLIALSLWIAGSDYINATTVALLGITLMIVFRVVTWEDIVGYKSAWGVLVWFATMVTLADGLSRVGFVKWLTDQITPTLSSMPLTTAVILAVTIFYWIHYIFASLTAHVTALLPVFLLVLTKLGVPAKAAGLLLAGTIGLMGIISPYATGPAPVYYNSGYIESRKFWLLGLIYGIIYFVAYIVIEVPWILSLH